MSLDKLLSGVDNKDIIYLDVEHISNLMMYKFVHGHDKEFESITKLYMLKTCKDYPSMVRYASLK